MSHYEKIKQDALEKGIAYFAEQKHVFNGYAEDLVLHYCVMIYGDQFQPPQDPKWVFELLREMPDLLTRDTDENYSNVYAAMRGVVLHQVIMDITPRLTEIAVAAGYEHDPADGPRP